MLVLFIMQKLYKIYTFLLKCTFHPYSIESNKYQIFVYWPENMTYVIDNLDL